MEKSRIVVILALFALLLVAATHVHEVGSPGTADMDDFYIHFGQEQTGSNNIVTAILFDYRGLDTLGEASVLFAAATGVFIVFRRLKEDEK